MKYIALTIGPIYKTLGVAKKTRELWGASYIFSYVMKKTVERFKDREFITPYIDETVFEGGKEVGLFHDRFIFKAKDGDKNALSAAIDDVLQNLSNDMKISYDFLKGYFQINFVEVEIADDKNPILEITPFLDSIELFYNIGVSNEKELSEKLKGNNSFLTKEAFGEKKSFPSLPEIALYDLKEQFNIKALLKDDELEIYEDNEIKKALKPYHKYIAIVHADGDNMGKVIENTATLKDTSKKLFDFCVESHKKIKSYGGQTIFAGGDDLLFFAPVASYDKTIFNLIDELSKDFNAKFSPNATLSFGVSVTYYKFPLYEALAKSRKLLFEQAKEKTKNNIAFEVVKHSGQSFGGVVYKSGDAYERFLEFVGVDYTFDETFLDSLHHKINLHAETLKAIKSDKGALKNFFDNYFNEAPHKKHQDFFDKLIEYMSVEQDLDNVYGALRFIKFLKGDK